MAEDIPADADLTISEVRSTLYFSNLYVRNSVKRPNSSLKPIQPLKFKSKKKKKKKFE